MYSVPKLKAHLFCISIGVNLIESVTYSSITFGGRGFKYQDSTEFGSNLYERKFSVISAHIMKEVM